MKTVHPNTRRKIIQQHEAAERLVITIAGQTFVDVSLKDIREQDRAYGYIKKKGTLTLEVGVWLDGFLRFRKTPTDILPKSKWTKIRKFFTKASLKKSCRKFWRVLTYVPE